jgi:hypothetical protein
MPVMCVAYHFYEICAVIQALRAQWLTCYDSIFSGIKSSSGMASRKGAKTQRSGHEIVFPNRVQGENGGRDLPAANPSLYDIALYRGINDCFPRRLRACQRHHSRHTVDHPEGEGQANDG